MGMTMDEFDRCIDALLADLMKSSTSDWATIDKVIEITQSASIPLASIVLQAGQSGIRQHGREWRRICCHAAAGFFATV
jgi:hypothetical protein